MPVERRDPAAHSSFVDKGGRGEMIKAPIELQDLRRRIYVPNRLGALLRQGFGWRRWSRRWLVRSSPKVAPAR
jgi:hypothetical protein